MNRKKEPEPPLPAWAKEAVRPAWIEEAFTASIPYVNEKLCGGEMTRQPQSEAQEGADQCFCCGVPAAVLLGPGFQGKLAMMAHRIIVGRLFKEFSSAGATPSQYAEMFMRVLVPTFNAFWIDVRRCIECGARFDLNSIKEVSLRRLCSECAA